LCRIFDRIGHILNNINWQFGTGIKILWWLRAAAVST